MKLAAGIVTFNPDINRLKENIEAIYSQVQLIILVDNNSENISYIEEEYKNKKKLILIKNKANEGIAKALNQIMYYLKEQNFDWALTLDQDSICPSNIIREYSKYLNLPNIAIVSPLIIDLNRQNKKIEFSTEYTVLDRCITSGSLTNIKIWNEIGGFDNAMFIDLVDFDYCKRLEINDYKIIRINTVKLFHEIGQITNHKFLFWNVVVKNHNSFRKYYMARNILYNAKKYRDSSNLLESSLRILKIILITIIFEKDKRAKLKSIFNGVLDAKKLKISRF